MVDKLILEHYFKEKNLAPSDNEVLQPGNAEVYQLHEQTRRELH